MENSSDTQNTSGSCCSSGGASQGGGCWLCKVDYKFIFEKAKEVIVTPKTCWKSIKEDGRDIKRTFLEYYWLLALIPAVFGFIKGSIIGYSIPFVGSYRMPLLGGIWFNIVTYLQMVIFALVFAYILEKLASKFEGKTDLASAFKLVAYASTPSLAASVFQVFGLAFSLLALLAGIYAIYVFYQGITEMTGVPEPKRIKYAAASIVISIVCAIVLSIVLSVIRPSFGPSSSDSSNKITIDMEKLQKNIENFQKMVPQNQ